LVEALIAMREYDMAAKEIEDAIDYLK